MLSRIGMRDNPIHHGPGKNTPVSGEYFLTLTIDRTHQLCGGVNIHSAQNIHPPCVDSDWLKENNYKGI